MEYAQCRPLDPTGDGSEDGKDGKDSGNEDSGNKDSGNEDSGGGDSGGGDSGEGDSGGRDSGGGDSGRGAAKVSQACRDTEWWRCPGWQQCSAKWSDCAESRCCADTGFGCYKHPL